MEIEQIVEELNELIKEGKEKVLSTKWCATAVLGQPLMVNSDSFAAWQTKALSFIKLILPPQNDFIKRFEQLNKTYFTQASTCIKILENVVEYINKGFLPFEKESSLDVDAELNRVFSRFHKIARQLRSRYADRATIDITDEYDVQDLLHALLKLYFDDIRAEEWTPSYAGKSARVDFLLKNEQIVIEVKKTRQGLADKELGDQLIIDVDRYKAHPDCKKLICFVYDPEGRVTNPAGLINDLNTQHQGFVDVIIEPDN